MAVHRQKTQISRFADLEQTPTLRDLFFFGLVEVGVWLAKRGMIVMSLPPRDEDLAKLELAVDQFMVAHKSLLK